MNFILNALNNLDYNLNVKSNEYYNSRGINVPRVTEILSSMIHNDALMYWANSLGFKGLKYKTVLNESAKYGTLAHKTIEIFLKEKIKSEDNIPFLGFLLWYNILTQDLKLNIDTIYIEHRMVCDWFGGTLDALFNIGGKLYLIDFKTSNHVTYTYFLQLSAYRFMLKNEENIDIDGVIVIQLNKEEPGFNEFLLDFSIQEHRIFIDKCENAFLSLVYSYYNIESVKSDFNRIF